MLRFTAFAALLALASASSWSWSRTDAVNGVNGWATLVSTCDAATNARQSPVDLTGAVLDTSLSLTYSASYSQSLSVNLTNDHGKVYWSYTDAGHDLFVTVPMSGVDTEFVLDGVHMHWGTTGTGGSEHTVDGHQFTAEIHFVHYMRSDGSVAAALAAGADHLLVVGVFVQVVDGDFTTETTFSSTLKSMFTTNFPSITTSGDSTPITLSALSLIPAGSSFYNYPGGLTTPDCNGVVQWFVYKVPHVIDSATITSAMWDSSSAPLTSTNTVHGPNWRPTLAIGSRTIKTSGSGLASISVLALVAAALVAKLI